MANNKKMKTLGGYEIVDEKARKDIETISGKADEAYSLAKGATKAFVYDTYSDMISELNQLDKAELLVNYHIMIRTVCVPDLWISGVSDEHIEYAYTSNEDFIVDLTEDGVVQVGYFVLSALETQKVELYEYVKNTDYASKENAGVVKIDGGLGMKITNDGRIYVRGANNDEVDEKSNKFIVITPNNVDYAVMKALSDSKLEWTDDEKALARTLLGAIGSGDIANKDKAGIMRAYQTSDKNVPGVGLSGNNIIGIVRATDTDIDEQTNTSKPIVPSNLSYAVKVGLTNNNEEWTDEEKASAMKLLGGVREEWKTIREFTIENEEIIANDTESGITWTVDDNGNITSFSFDTDTNGNIFSANKFRYIIYPSDSFKNGIFGGKKGYLNVTCNYYNGNIYSATNTAVGYRLQGVIENDMSGILKQVAYMGADRNSYANERPHINFFNRPGHGYLSAPINKFTVACDPDIWFVQGAKVIVQICEEVG